MEKAPVVSRDSFSTDCGESADNRAGAKDTPDSMLDSLALKPWLLPVAATTATATATATAVGLGASLIDVEGAAIEIGTVECLDGVTAGTVGHGDEAESAGAAGVTVCDDGDVFDVAVGGEGGTKAVFGGIETHVTYEDFQTRYSKLGLLTNDGLGRRGAVFGIQNSRRPRTRAGMLQEYHAPFQATACFCRFV